MRLNKIINALTWPVLAFAVILIAPARVLAHCDGLDGPVVKAAQRALDTRNPAFALIWVQAKDESEVRATFERTLAVRALSPKAKELADHFFFETLVRVHRAGEGAPYTGLKPAGRDLGPAIPAADKAIQAGSVDPLVKLLRSAMEQRIGEHFGELISAKAFPASDVRAAGVVPNVVAWRCNICGAACQTPLAALTREQPSCSLCRSSVRRRSLVHLLSTALFGESLALPDFPLRRDLRGLGLSDWEALAAPLARKLSFTNTYFHQQPRMDITAIDPALEGTLDFLIASEVFEHIAPPVAPAFVNARRLLKPGGVLVFSAPYAPAGETVEHFPDLHDYQVIEQHGRPVLRNVTRDGR